MKTIRSESAAFGFTLTKCLLLGLALLAGRDARAQVVEGGATQTYASAWSSPQAAPAMTAFRSWAEQYAAASPAVQGQMLSQGVDLAKTRKAILAAMIKTNPAAAISLSVPVSVRSKLPANVVAELETRVSGIGDVDAYCAFPSLLTRIPQKGIYATVTLNGAKYNAYSYGRRTTLITKHGIPLHGVAVGDVLALHESPVRELETGEAPAANAPVVNLAQGQTAVVTAEIGGQVYTFGSRGQFNQTVQSLTEAEAGFGPQPKQSSSAILQSGSNQAGPVVGSPWTEGLKNVLVIRVDFPDVQGDPRSRGANPTIYTAAYVKNLIDTEVNPYYQSSSYGLTTLTNTVTTQLYRMPQAASFYATNFTVDQMHADARTLANADYNVAGFDRVFVLFSPLENIPNSLITFGGLAQVNGPNLWVNGEWDFRIASHELGHTYGLIHGNLWQVTGNNAANLGGTSIEYGDDYDTQGANFADSKQVDFNPWFKTLLDWIPNTNVITVTSNGIYRVSRFDHTPIVGTNVLALKIPKDSTRNYWVSCKRSFTSNSSMSTGAYIIWGYNILQGSDLLDMTTPGSNIQDAALGLGRSFVDTNSNITITPIAGSSAPNNEYIDIQILLGPNTNLVTVDAGDAFVVEGDSGNTNITFDISLSGPTTSPVTVDFTLVSQTATVGLDVVATNGTVTFSPGETDKTVNVAVIGDTLVEFNETFLLQLTNVSANATIFQTGGVGTIIDDDLFGVIDLVVSPNTNALQLVSALISTNSGLIVRDAQISGQLLGASLSAGTYQLLGSSPHTYGLTLPGIVISSGDVDDYETGPDFINGFSTDYGVAATSAQETLLDTITGGTFDHFDVTQLDIYFDVAPGSNNVTFQVVFGSEEYPDFVNSPFVDGFGIFLNGTNIAFQSGKPVNINHPAFTPYAGTELNGVLAPNGQAVLTFSALVAPNSVSNKLTFIVGDTSDTALDTTVYISSLAAVEPPPVPVATINDALPVVEGNTMTNVSFDVTLSMVSTQQVSFAYLAANGKAKRGEDFVATAGTLIFAPGVTNATINVPIIGDLIDEPNEGFSVVIFAPTNAYIGRSQAYTTILDDDDQAAKITVTDGTITEGDSGTKDFAFNINLSERSGHVVTVNYGTAPGTASVGLDYLPKSGTLAFEPGETSKTLLVKVVGDTVFEPTETFFLNLSTATFATIDDNQGQATILDNDTLPILSVADVTVTEGDTGNAAMVFTVKLSNPTASTVTVDYFTADGTATVADNDYTSVTGTLTIEPGQLQATVTVPIQGDLLVEGNETLTFNLDNPVNAGAGDMQATGTIVNDDGPNLSITGTSVQEGAFGTTVNALFTVTLSKPDGSTVMVDYEVLAGSATENADYVPTTGTLTFPDGTTSLDIPVVINGDDLAETNETFTVHLKNVVNGTIAVADAQGVIVDDDTIANLALGITLPSTNIYVGHPFTIALTVTNNGAFGATNVTIGHVLPTGFELVSSSFVGVTGTVSQAGSIVSGVIPVLTNGQTAGLNLVVTGSIAAVTTFDASVSSDQFDDDESDNSVSQDKELIEPIVTIEKAGSVLVSESLLPANRGLDAGETVTVAFALKNTGTIATTNLIAILRSESGIATNEGAKSYGSVEAGGASVAQQFVFSVTGDVGSTVTAVLDLYDMTATGSNSLGSVSFAYQLGEDFTITSSATVTIPAIGPADTYPSVVNVSGLVGRVAKVTVQINGLTHSFPDDLDILLVSPDGKGVILMSDAGAGADVAGIDLTFDDAAETSLPDASVISAGQYKPTNYGSGDVFADAPAGPYGTALASFIGIVPNGDWKLYIVDDGAGDSGSITGWSLSIQTTIPAELVAELAVSGKSTPNPAYVGQNFTYSITVTNMGPDAASNLRLTSLLPVGVSIVTSTPAVSATDGNELTFSLGGLAAGSSTVVSIEVVSSSAGTPTNRVSVVADEIDLQSQNSTTLIGTRINRVTTLAASSESSPGAPFTLNLAGQPGLTYVIEVSTNLVNWTPVYTNTTLDGVLNFTDSESTGTGLRFYRALER